MKKEMRYKPVLLLMALILLLPVFTACEPSGKELAIAFVEEWMNENDITPRTFKGAMDIGRRVTSDSTGDPEADAALETINMVRNFVQAESLMEKGRKNRDSQAMDDAIKLRPGDWTYRLSREIVAIENGDIETARKQGMEAWNSMVPTSNKSLMRWCNQGINELEQLRREDKWASNEARSYAYGRLSARYGIRATVRESLAGYSTTESKQDREAADAFNELSKLYEAK